MCVSVSHAPASQAYSDIRTLDVSQVAASFGQSHAALLKVSGNARNALTTASPALSATSLPAGALAQLHITPTGDLLATTSHTEGHEGDVLLHGSIFNVPYELHLNVKLEGTTITLTLELKKPIQVGPFTWTFELGGASHDDAGKLIAANAITLNTATTSLAPGTDVPSKIWACLLKCVSDVVPGILTSCLPSLIGGPNAFIQCVIAQLGKGGAQIVLCLAKCLFGGANP